MVCTKDMLVWYNMHCYKVTFIEISHWFIEWLAVASAKYCLFESKWISLYVRQFNSFRHFICVNSLNALAQQKLLCIVLWSLSFLHSRSIPIYLDLGRADLCALLAQQTNPMWVVFYFFHFFFFLFFPIPSLSLALSSFEICARARAATVIYEVWKLIDANRSRIIVQTADIYLICIHNPATEA